MIDFGAVRIGLHDALVASLTAMGLDVEAFPIFTYPPDDFVQVPLIYLDLPTISGSLAINGGTALRIPIIAVSTRTDHEKSLQMLEILATVIWAALGDGKSVEVPAGCRASCRSADPEQMTSADTTWPAMRFAVDIELGLTC